MNISSRTGIDYPVVLPVQRVDILDYNEFLNELERILNSNQQFSINQDLLIQTVVVHMPMGGGNNTKRNSVILEKWLRSCRSVVKIARSNDNLCCAKSIIIGLAHIAKTYHKLGKAPPGWLDKSPFYKSLMWGPDKYKNLQRASVNLLIAANKLHFDANVPLNTCGIPELDMFQKYLDSFGITLNVFSAPNENFFLYQGKIKHPFNIYIFYHESHYDAVVNVCGFLRKEYFCHKCNVSFPQLHNHMCTSKCPHCFTLFDYAANENLHKGEAILCKKCSRSFQGKECFEAHLKATKRHNSVCQNYRYCPNKMCNVYIKGQKEKSRHRCGRMRCKRCHEYKSLTAVHQCYMRVLKHKSRRGNKKNINPNIDSVEMLDDPLLYHNNANNEDITYTSEEGKYRMVVFDTETVINSDYNSPKSILTAICCCAKSVCHNCSDDVVSEDTPICSTCCRERTVTFYGRKSLNEFCKWLFDTDRLTEEAKKIPLTVVAHNFQVSLL